MRGQQSSRKYTLFAGTTYPALIDRLVRRAARLRERQLPNSCWMKLDPASMRKPVSVKVPCTAMTPGGTGTERHGDHKGALTRRDARIVNEFK